MRSNKPTTFAMVNNYPEIWQKEIRQAENAILEAARRAAGTDAILDDPGKFLDLAKRAEVIAKDRGEALHQHGDKETLSQFFERYYLPLVDGGEQHVTDMRYAVRRWVLATGDPPLKEIDVLMLTRFRDFLQTLPGRGTKTLSPTTVKNKLNRILSILTKAGPAGPKNRDAAGIIEQVPWIKPPKVPTPNPRIVPDELINRCYAAAERMERPQIRGLEPADWWRALLVL